MIHVYPLATAFNVDDEKDDNDDENSWIITCNSCSQKRRRQSHIRFLKMGYAILKKRISNFVEWHVRFFANVRI